jgi:hypothetical protein
MPVFINLPNTLSSEVIDEPVELNVNEDEQSQDNNNQNGN